MNDIELHASKNGCFDWSFNQFDVENVIGEQQLVSEVIHQVLLRDSELEQYLYQGDGTDVTQYAKLSYDDSSVMVRSEIELRCKMIEGVKDASVTLGTGINNELLITNIRITKENGGVVEIGGL